MRTITYKEYNKRIDRYNNSIERGLIPILKKNYVKIGFGIAYLSIAIFPNGLGIVFYPLGFYLLGVSLLDIENIKRKIKNIILPLYLKVNR